MAVAPVASVLRPVCEQSSEHEPPRAVPIPPAGKASERVVNLPLFDPRDPVDPGKKPVVFNNVAAFFIEGMQGNDVIGRFLYASGVGVGSTGSGGGADTGAMAMFVRLVE